MTLTTNYVERQMSIETEPEPELEEEPELEVEDPGYNELQTLSGHSDDVGALVVDQATKTLFSGSYDDTIKVWTPDDSGN